MAVPDDVALSPLHIGEDLKEKAYRALKEAILRGALTSGRRYSEQSLAEQLGVSRTPVREALLKLAAEGWVRYWPRRGVEIVHPTAEDALHFHQLRQAIEGYVAETLAGQIGPDVLGALERIAEAQAVCIRRRDWPGYMAEASRFHACLVDALRNPRFTELYARLTEQLQLFGLEAIHTSRYSVDRLAEHRRLIEALRSGDGGLARQITLAHIRQTMESLAAAPRDRPTEER